MGTVVITMSRNSIKERESTIKLPISTKRRLNEFKEHGDTYNHVIKKLLKINLMEMNKMTDKQAYNLQKFLILQSKFNPETCNKISDGYAYAWAHDVYPFFHDMMDWHIGFENVFRVNKDKISNIISFIDEGYINKKYYSFYQLEDKYGQNSRVALIDILRYTYLSGRFSRDIFWETLMSDHPAEASLLNSEFKLDYLDF